MTIKTVINKENQQATALAMRYTDSSVQLDLKFLIGLQCILF